MKGRIAMGSARSSPLALSAADVVSDIIVAPLNTPCSQSSDCTQRGIVSERRPPKIIALMGTPSEEFQFGSSDGHWSAGAVKRELGCAALPSPGDHSRRSHEMADEGGGLLRPSHHTSPSFVSATFWGANG